MKLKLISIVGVVLFSGSLFAATVKCEVKTNFSDELQVIEHTIGTSGHPGASFFETGDFTGFISSSRGYLVASITLRETNQTSNFHGVVGENGVGGAFISGNNWLQVSCN